MFNKTEEEERIYLERVKKKISQAIGQVDQEIGKQVSEMQEQKEYLNENIAELDKFEKLAITLTVRKAVLSGESALKKKKRLQKLLLSPYFGRIDFAETNQHQQAIYLGVHAFFDEAKKENIVFDWRAPISTMFYDFETGPVYYEAPQGIISGEMTRKRQYRIRQGQMEYMIESSLNIHDDILQKELSKSSDDKMKHIVATIQRDQNTIIRNETSRTLIIQGVAGSGKTSIALHRIAFLLYRFKDSISADDILILSPNKVFADYISNVLPELGEDRIPEMGMEELAGFLLQDKYRFQTFFDQVNILLEKKEDDLRERIRYKSSFELVTRLNEYLVHVENNYFEARSILVGRYPIPAPYIDEIFQSFHRMPLFKRFDEIAENIERNLKLFNQFEMRAKERNELKKNIREMFRFSTIRDLYANFYQWLGRPELFRQTNRKMFEYADVFPLIFMKIKLEGVQTFGKVKHLLIDEMQDYTPIQYAVLAQLFPCKKTVLGDASQSVNPYGSSTTETISKALPGADCMKLTKSYRSTSEIAFFTQRITPNSELEVIERHGEEPAILACKTRSEYLQQIQKLIDNFYRSDYNSMGIICKTQKQAEQLYEALPNKQDKVKLLTVNSSTFSDGIIICSTHLSKGLEFDEVVVPQADDRNYHEPIDKGLLYIACTRAMHRLTLVHQGNPTPFIRQ